MIYALPVIAVPVVCCTVTGALYILYAFYISLCTYNIVIIIQRTSLYDVTVKLIITSVILCNKQMAQRVLHQRCANFVLGPTVHVRSGLHHFVYLYAVLYCSVFMCVRIPFELAVLIVF